MFLPCASSSIVVATTAEPATFAFTYWPLHALLLFAHFQSADMCFALSIFLLQLSITCCQTRKLQLFDMLSHTVEATCSIFTHQTHRWTMEPRSINITRVGKHTLEIRQSKFFTFGCVLVSKFRPNHVLIFFFF